MSNQEEGVSRTADGRIAAIHEDQIAKHADELRADPTFRMDEATTGEQAFRDHLAQTQLSPATQDMMVYEPPVSQQVKPVTFRPNPESIKLPKHNEFIFAVDNEIFADKGTGIVQWDYEEFLAAAHPRTIIGQRAVLEKDTRYRQFLPYTMVTQLQGGKVHFATYHRTNLVGEEKLAGKVSVGWGGHPDIADLVTGDYIEQSITNHTSLSAPTSPVINLHETLRRSNDRELEEELRLRAGNGNVMAEYLSTMASNVLILDTDKVGLVHVGLVRHAFIPAGYTVECREPELLYIGFRTADELLSGEYDLEGWTRLYLEYFVKSGLNWMTS